MKKIFTFTLKREAKMMSNEPKTEEELTEEEIERILEEEDRYYIEQGVANGIY